jgi:prevent-host-death family protein
MAREIAVRELRNHTAQVVAAVRGGEELSLTVNRTPVADIVPHVAKRSPWVSSVALRSIVERLEPIRRSWMVLLTFEATWSSTGDTRGRRCVGVAREAGRPLGDLRV